MFSALRRAFTAVLEAIAPLKPRAARTRMRRLEDIPLCVRSHALLGHRVITLFDYKRDDVRDLIQALKYDGDGAAAALAAAALADFLREEIASAASFSARDILLVPVPLHPSRKRERGFNQIDRILEALPREFRDGSLARSAPHLLMRTRATPSQTHRSRKGRLENMHGAFSCANEALAAHSHVYLIDDVATTGATLTAAAAPLSRAGAAVTLLALARA